MHIYIHMYILLDRLIPHCLAHVGSSLPSKFRFKRVCKKPRIDIECWNPHINLSFLRVPRHVPHIGRTKLRLFWREVKTTSTQVNIPSSYVHLRIGWRAPFLHIHSNGVGLFNLLPRTEWNVIGLPCCAMPQASCIPPPCRQSRCRGHWKSQGLGAVLFLTAVFEKGSWDMCRDYSSNNILL